ncbi:MAG: hypothetical protein ABIN93_04420 [Ginsengibacter sp.]
MYGLPRKNISLLKGGDRTYNYVDTNALYKLTINYLYNRGSKRYSYYERSDNNSYPYTSYYKFYSNGKVGLFVIAKKDTMNLTRNAFNPLNAKMGYYSVTGNAIKTKLETVNDCMFHLINERGHIGSDTLTLEDKNHHGNIYIKNMVPNELLKDWSPDW